MAERRGPTPFEKLSHTMAMLTSSPHGSDINAGTEDNHPDFHGPELHFHPWLDESMIIGRSLDIPIVGDKIGGKLRLELYGEEADMACTEEYGYRSVGLITLSAMDPVHEEHSRMNNGAGSKEAFERHYCECDGEIEFEWELLSDGSTSAGVNIWMIPSEDPQIHEELIKVAEFLGTQRAAIEEDFQKWGMADLDKQGFVDDKVLERNLRDLFYSAGPKGALPVIDVAQL